ncbi:MAG: hypothetical protein CSA81_03105 [Acidobacteria bacterium]|nr:MAG: hypothetical protein CSA81_03105 [Acidobacteriota bacterium]
MMLTDRLKGSVMLSNRKSIRMFVFSTLMVGTMACVTHKTTQHSHKELTQVESFSESGSIKSPDRWWQSFDSSELDDLIAEALSNNLDLQQAWSRLAQVEALHRKVRSSRLPGVDLGVSGSNSDRVSGDSPAVDSYRASLDLSYQLDLWGKIRAHVDQGFYDLQASRKDMEATALTLSGQVARIWLNLTEQQLMQKLVEEQIQVSRDYLKLVEKRFALGSATATEVLQQRLELQSSQNKLPAIEGAIAQLKNQMALLLGKAPGKDTPELVAAFPTLPELPQTGIPADLLRRRPDIRATEYRLFSSEMGLIAARADLYPRISLSASLSSSSTKFSDLLDNWLRNLAVNLMAPLFDGGKRRAEVDRNRALVDQRLQEWKKAVLTSILEVEDALVIEQTQSQTLTGIRQQVELAERTLSRARKSYINGLSSYLTVLTSLQALQNLQQSQIKAEKDLLANRVSLYLALGGNWTETMTLTQR